MPYFQLHASSEAAFRPEVHACDASSALNTWIRAGVTAGDVHEGGRHLFSYRQGVQGLLTIVSRSPRPPAPAGAIVALGDGTRREAAHG